MVRLAALTAALAASSASALMPRLDGVDMEHEFGAWMVHYEKDYSTDGEIMARMQSFSANRELVVAHNKAAAAGEHSYTLELNHLADLTNEEYRMQLLGFKSLGAKGTDSYAAPAVGAAPDAFDWRTVGTVVGDVKNQGSCGSCWAFSAVATMEGALNNKMKTSNSLSEQELVDCVNDGASTCSLGGEMYQGVEYGISKGMMSEADYAYKGKSGNKCAFDATKSVHTFSGYQNITSGDEAGMKEAAFAQPVLSIGIDASSFAFQLYHKGVYDPLRCKNKAEELDHGVAVVGYGTDGSKDYWVVRNSWGASWGMKGYVNMVRNKDNKCGVATQACFALV